MFIKIKNIIFFLIIALYFCFLKLKSSLQKPSNDKILFIQLSKMGDLICTTPVYRLVKDRMPKSKVMVLADTKLGAVLEGNPFIDLVMGIDSDRSILRLAQTIKKVAVIISLFLLHH